MQGRTQLIVFESETKTRSLLKIPVVPFSSNRDLDDPAFEISDTDVSKPIQSVEKSSNSTANASDSNSNSNANSDDAQSGASNANTNAGNAGKDGKNGEIGDDIRIDSVNGPHSMVIGGSYRSIVYYARPLLVSHGIKTALIASSSSPFSSSKGHSARYASSSPSPFPTLTALLGGLSLVVISGLLFTFSETHHLNLNNILSILLSWWTFEGMELALSNAALLFLTLWILVVIFAFGKLAYYYCFPGVPPNTDDTTVNPEEEDVNEEDEQDAIKNDNDVNN